MDSQEANNLSEPEKKKLKIIAQDANAKSFKAMQLKKGNRVMDFGCGAGHDLSSISNLVDINGEVWGVDTDPIMIKNAILNNTKSNVRFLKSSSTRLNFPDNYFHAIRAANVFPFLDTPRGILHELIRVLQKGGNLVILDMDWSTLSINSNHPSIEEEIKIAASTQMSKNMLNKGKLYDLVQKSDLDEVKIEVLPYCTDSIDAFNDTFFKSFSKINEKKELIAKHDLNIFTRGLYEKAKQNQFFSTICQILITAQKPILKHQPFLPKSKKTKS